MQQIKQQAATAWECIPSNARRQRQHSRLPRHHALQCNAGSCHQASPVFPTSFCTASASPYTLAPSSRACMEVLQGQHAFSTAGSIEDLEAMHGLACESMPSAVPPSSTRRENSLGCCLRMRSAFLMATRGMVTLRLYRENSCVC
jgi:hypothetical protein